jgi:hypothetical protein
LTVLPFYAHRHVPVDQEPVARSGYDAVHGQPCLVSIVMAVKNVCGLVEASWESWRSALSAEVELVVVDGGSTDGTRELLIARSTAIGNESVTVVAQDDSSIAEAWNNAIPVAKGSWLLFIGADDRFVDGSRWLGVLDRLRATSTSIEACLFPVEVVSRSGSLLDVAMPRLACDGRFSTGIAQLPHQGIFHRRSMWPAYGCFDASYSVAADYEFLVRARANGARLETCPEMSPVRMTFGGVSTRSPLRTLAEYRRVHRVHRIRGSRLAWGGMLAAAAARQLLAAAGLRRAADFASDFARTCCGRPKVWTIS